MVKTIEEQLFTNQYIGAASITLLFYDYLLTLPREVDRFWATRRITWVSGLFYLNRYLSLLGHIPVLFEYFWRSSNPDRLQLCVKFSNFHQYLAVAIQVIVGLLLIMRTYALYSCRKVVLIAIGVAGLIVIGYGIYSVLRGHSEIYTVGDLPPFGCLLPPGEEISKNLARAWTGMLAFDILIFTMTLYKSLTYRHEGSHILHIMLRDGTIYFGVMLAVTSSVLLSFHLSPVRTIDFMEIQSTISLIRVTHNQTLEQGMTAILTNIISSIMISRLMLNIRDPKIHSNHRPEGTTTATRTGAIFTTIIHSSIDDHSVTSRRDTETMFPANSRRSETGGVINSSIELHVRTTSPA